MCYGPFHSLIFLSTPPPNCTARRPLAKVDEDALRDHLHGSRILTGPLTRGWGWHAQPSPALVIRLCPALGEGPPPLDRRSFLLVGHMGSLLNGWGPDGSGLVQGPSGPIPGSTRSRSWHIVPGAVALVDMSWHTHRIAIPLADLAGVFTGLSTREPFILVMAESRH